MIDGFRYGFFGQSDEHVMLSMSVVAITWLSLSLLVITLLSAGYKLRN